MSGVPKGVRGHYPTLTHPDVIPVPTHVGCAKLGQMVPVVSNSPKQWWAESGLMLRVTVGSGVHGMALAGLDDIDESGVFVEAPETVFGHRDCEHYTYRTQPEGVCSGPGDLDLVIYSLRKYVSLAAAGNPTVLLPLFVPDAEVQFINTFGEELRANRSWFASKQAGARFRGYLDSQRRGLKGERSGGTRNKGRKDIRDRLGFDAKFASHMIRLGIQGVEYLTTGEMTLPIPEPDLKYLRDLKSGVYLEGLSPDTPKGRALADKKLAETLRKAEQLEVRLDDLVKTTRLPDEPNRKAIDQWVADVHLRHWGLK